MSIACSNVRLSGSFGPACSPGELCGDVSMTEQTGNEYWSKRLTDGATELSVSIQNNIQSKQLEFASNSATENGDSKDEADAKRMETVLISYLLSRSKSVLFHFFLLGLCFSFADFSFHDRISEVWEIFCPTGCYYWALLPCSIITGIQYGNFAMVP